MKTPIKPSACCIGFKLEGVLFHGCKDHRPYCSKSFPCDCLEREKIKAQNTKMREALRYYAEESNQNEDGLYVLSHDGWFDGSEHDGSEYIVPFDNGTTAQKALSSLLP